MALRFILLLACVASVCMPSAASAERRSPLIDQITARRHGLTRAWFRQIELDRSRDRVESVTIYDGMLFVQTKRGSISALDAETGRNLWTTHVGDGRHVTSQVGAGPEYVAVVSGTTLYVFARIEKVDKEGSRKPGSFIWKKRVRGVPGAGPAVGVENIFVPTAKGTLEAHSITDTKKPIWYYTASGVSLVQPIVSGESVSWSTDKGLFYVASADRLTARYRVETQSEIVAQPAYLPPHLFVGSVDGHLYKVHERSGAIRWRFSTGEAVIERPLAIKDRVYVTSRDSGLFCVQAEEPEDAEAIANNEIPEVRQGREIWWTPHINKILAASPTRLYTLNDSGRMIILRQKDGAPIDSLATENLDFSVVNSKTDRIYIGTRTGLIQCLHEPALKDPVKHGSPGDGPGVAKKGRPKKGLGDLAGEIKEDGAEKEGDIFSGDAGAEEEDIFGNDGDDAKGGDDGAAEEEEDPFS